MVKYSKTIIYQALLIISVFHSIAYLPLNMIQDVYTKFTKLTSQKLMFVGNLPHK